MSEKGNKITFIRRIEDRRSGLEGSRKDWNMKGIELVEW